jgi:hypothetical protein
MAVEVLKGRGVPEERILFLNLIASPEGITTFAAKFPRLKVVTAFIDEVGAVIDRWFTWSVLTESVCRVWMRRSIIIMTDSTMHWLTLLQLYCAWSWGLWRPILYDLKNDVDIAFFFFSIRPWYLVCINIPNSVTPWPVPVDRSLRARQ